VVGKQAGAPEGSTVRFDVSGALGRRVDVTVAGGRARVLDDDAPTQASPTLPTATLQMDQQTLWRLTGGRMTGADALEAGLVRVSGDGDLGRRVATSMAFMI
jgi:hypothetical protein